MVCALSSTKLLLTGKVTTIPILRFCYLVHLGAIRCISVGNDAIADMVSQQVIDSLEFVSENPFPQLEHPGKVFYLDKPSGKSYGIYQTSKKFFGKILLRSGFIDNHSSRAYKEAFSNVDLSKYLSTALTVHYINAV